jgi:hypothetical protein
LPLVRLRFTPCSASLNPVEKLLPDFAVARLQSHIAPACKAILKHLAQGRDSCSEAVLRLRSPRGNLLNSLQGCKDGSAAGSLSHPWPCRSMPPSRRWDWLARGTASSRSRQESLVSSSLFVLLPTAQTPFFALNPSSAFAGFTVNLLLGCASQPTSTSRGPLRPAALPAVPADKVSTDAPQEVDPLC